MASDGKDLYVFGPTIMRIHPGGAAKAVGSGPPYAMSPVWDGAVFWMLETNGTPPAPTLSVVSFDPATGKWGHAVALPPNTLWSYDPATFAFQGKLFFLGMGNASGVETFDTSTGQLVQVASLPFQLNGWFDSMAWDGRDAWIFGADHNTTNVWRFDPVTLQAVKVARLALGVGETSAVWAGCAVLLAGSEDYDAPGLLDWNHIMAFTPGNLSSFVVATLPFPFNKPYTAALGPTAYFRTWTGDMVAYTVDLPGCPAPLPDPPQAPVAPNQTAAPQMRPRNEPPTIDAPPEITTFSGATVRFQVNGRDREGDPLHLTASGLPGRASFDAATRTFAWTPTTQDLGKLCGLEFTVTEFLVDFHDATPDAPNAYPQAARATTCINVLDPAADADHDGVANAADDCPAVADRDQADRDGDGVGDACKSPSCSRSPGGASCAPAQNASSPAVATDSDGDGRPDARDNCPTDANARQEDQDGDGTGDACDADVDGDGVPNTATDRRTLLDNCPSVANADQRDSDRDGVGDACQHAGRAAVGSAASVRPSGRARPAPGLGVADATAFAAALGVLRSARMRRR